VSTAQLPDWRRKRRNLATEAERLDFLTSSGVGWPPHRPIPWDGCGHHLAGTVGFHLGLQAGRLEKRAFGQVYLGSIAFIPDPDGSTMLAIDLVHFDDPLKHARHVTEQGSVLGVLAEAELPVRLNLKVEFLT
jgi:hypothetical protein